MNTASRIRTRVLVAAMMLALAGSAFAAEPAPTKSAEPSKQAREQMAKMHEEMAACLRSDKAFADCRTQMHEHCMTTMGEKGCPMMGAGMQHGKPQPPTTDKQ
jgi:hypothetical protein